MDLRSAYRARWSFRAPRSFLTMHAAGLFVPLAGSREEWAIALRTSTAKGTRPRIVFGTVEIFDAETIAEGDAWVEEDLIPGLVPLGGDGSGDRYCFDARGKLHGTTAVALCPHDGGGATYVAPSFAGFVFRTLLEDMASGHVWTNRGFSQNDMVGLFQRNLAASRRYLLKRWARAIAAVIARGERGDWPKKEEILSMLAQDTAFARLPEEEFDHFR